MSEGGTSKGKLVVLAMFALAVVFALGFVFWKPGASAPTATAEPSASGAHPGAANAPNAPNAPPTPAAQTTRISFMYGSEKKTWLVEALSRFAKAHPEITVDVAEKGSLDMVQAMLDQNARPTLISPADDVALNLLTSDWRQKYGSDLVATDGAAKAVPLVLTPLVLVAWEDRARVISTNQQELTFKRLHAAVDSPKGWPGVGGKPDWGFVKLGHTNPTRSNSGLQALILMAYEFQKKRAGLEIKDVIDEKFQTFVKGLERGVTKFGDSSGTFMEEMVLYGPSKYDVVVTYENLAIQHIPNAQGRWGNLRVFYPSQTMWSSHPIAVLQGDWVTAGQRAAAQTLIAFLREKPEQQRALALGFRPANPEVNVLGENADSPFQRAQAFGVRTDLGSVVEAPPGPVVRNLMEMWARQVGR
ncbi:MAG: extracellular solute-binding protein [Myxococcota bacterium]